MTSGLTVRTAGPSPGAGPGPVVRPARGPAGPRTAGIGMLIVGLIVGPGVGPARGPAGSRTGMLICRLGGSGVMLVRVMLVFVFRPCVCAAYCAVEIARCILHAAYYAVHITRCMLRGAYYAVHVARCLLPGAC